MDNKTEDVNKTKQEIHAILEELGEQVPAQARPLIEEAMIKMKTNPLLPKDALGFNPPTMEVIYQYGYNLFQNGKYQDALIIFNVLQKLDILDTRYSFAIAACHQYSKNYLEAAAQYLIVQSLDPSNPVPRFHLYDCYMKANYPLSALQAIQEALILAELNPEYAELREKIQVELEHLKNILKANKEV